MILRSRELTRAPQETCSAHSPRLVYRSSGDEDQGSDPFKGRCNRGGHLGGVRNRLADLDPIGACALPIVQHHAVRLDEGTDLGRAHLEYLVKDRHNNAEGIVAENGGLCDPC